MRDLSQAATVTTDDRPLPPLVRGLRERHAALSARDPRARAFELRLPDRTAWSIGFRPGITASITRATVISTTASSTTGPTDPGRLGLFRGLEWIIARWTGAQPQGNDHEWLRRFGRKVIGRKA